MATYSHNMRVHPVEAEWSEPLSTSQSSTSASKPLSQFSDSHVSAASKPFIMDNNGCKVDASLRPGFCLPQFLAEPLEQSYKEFRWKLLREGRGAVTQASLFAVLAAFATVEAVTTPATRTVSAYPAARLFASALAMSISLVFLQNFKCFSGFLPFFQAGNAGLVVRTVERGVSYFLCNGFEHCRTTVARRPSRPFH